MSIPTPPNGMVSNTELILRKILGEDVTPLPPNSRVEFYLTQVEEYIERLATGATRPIGETTTPLTDGATTNPIQIDGNDYTAQINDLVFYGNKEFLFTANGWREVGDITNLNADMIDDTNTTKKFTNATEKETWNGKQDSTLATWTPGSATTHSTPAVDDTITEALQKIDNNQRNDEANILAEQAKTTGMSEGGSNYITVGSIRLYVSATAPTGARTGDLWIGG